MAACVIYAKDMHALVADHLGHQACAVAIAFMTEPFGDEARLRAGWAVYQLAHGRPFTELPFTDAVAVPTLILYGPDDHAVRSDFLAFTEVAYTNRVGPLVVPGAGHFLQWERADIFNAIVSAVLIDR